jgi:peptidoglycan/LPS O-acetylase OafA/YrhL
LPKDNSDHGDAVSHPVGPKFRPDIEGLRAVAVVAVVLFHAGVPGVGGGFIGVDVFFVISGFLITGLLWREVSTAGTIRLRRFYGARARRLLPASATVGVVTAIGSFVLIPPLLAKTFLVDGIASALYVSNFWFCLQATDYFISQTTPSPFQHYWSLGVEEQFYLVWPAVIICSAWVIRRVGRRFGARAVSSKKPYLFVLLVVGLMSLAACVLVTHIWPIAAFYLLPTRAWELALGGMIALTVTQWRRLPPLAASIAGWAGLGAVVFTCARFSGATPFPGFAALLPVLGAAVVIGAGCAAPARGVGRVLSLAPMRAIGRLSYSWYLWHWPVLIFAPLVVGHPLGLAGRLTAVVISVALAELTLRFVEDPLRFAAPVRRSPARSLALGGAATVVAVCVGVALLVSVPVPVGRGPAARAVKVVAGPAPSGLSIEPYDAAVRYAFAQVEGAVAEAVTVKAVPSNLQPPLADAAAEKWALMMHGCMRNVIEVGQPECASGDTGSTTTVALIGDSNAAMWNPALQQVAEQRRWRLESLAKQGCPLLDLPFIALQRKYAECDQWRGDIVARLRAEHPRLIVLAISRLYGPGPLRSYGAAWIDSLTRLMQQLRGTGAQVLVVGPIPKPGSAVPICLSGHLEDAGACTPRRSIAVNEPGIAAEIAATKAGGAQYADVTALFCTADRCPVIVGNTLVYLDEYHLTVEYARLLGPVIGALADRVLVNG